MTDRKLSPQTGAGARGALAQRIAAAVDAVPGARRYAGSGVRIATQFRGGSVIGVRLGDEEIGVHVVTSDLRVRRLAAAVRASVASVLDSGTADRVVVYIDDLDVETERDRPAGPAELKVEESGQ